jgi:hypothetical protein
MLTIESNDTSRRFHREFRIRIVFMMMGAKWKRENALERFHSELDLGY